jgi:hypothetical protein
VYRFFIKKVMFTYIGVGDKITVIVRRGDYEK